MMTDDEAFSALGEVMAQVGNPWPRYSREDIMRMQYEQYMYCKLRNIFPHEANLGLYVYGLTPRI